MKILNEVSPPTWWHIAIPFSVLGACVLIGVLIAVMTHSEAGLLRVCWVPFGNGQKAQYVEGLDKGENASCSAPEELKWPGGYELAIVLVGGGDVISEHRAVITSAINIINKQLSTSLILKTDATESDIEVKLDAPINIGDGVLGKSPGYCLHEKTEDGRMFARMVIRPGGMDQQLQVAVHELGHCLGLAHDTENSASIMRPVLETSEFGPIGTVLFSDHDRQLFRKLVRKRR